MGRYRSFQCAVNDFFFKPTRQLKSSRVENIFKLNRCNQLNCRLDRKKKKLTRPNRVEKRRRLAKDLLSTISY